MTPAYKTKRFWIVTALTLLGLLGASGAVTDSNVTEAIGWVVTLFASLGLRGWGPQEPPAAPPAEV